MTDSYVTCNGERLTALTINVANVGPWIAELEFIDAPVLSGKVEIKVGDNLTLVGTVVEAYDGTHLEQRRCRVVGGASGWGRTLGRKHYHNDLGVKAQQIVTDVVREAGETLGTFEPEAERVGRDYVRSMGTASRTLEDVVGNVAWWVDYAGVTNVGVRPSFPMPVNGGYDVLTYDPRARLLTFSVDDPAIVAIGAVIASVPLEAPQTIREFDLHIDGDSTRVVAWCGGTDRHRGRLAGLMQAITRRVTDGPLYGKYRYRVVAMRGDGRVDLQAVRKDAGLPDVQPISQWPGVAGAHAELAPGGECLVEFIEGDPAQPIVTHYVGVGGPGFSPVSLAFCESIQAAARQGDLVQSGGAGCTCVLTPVVPGAGPVTPGTPYLISFGVTAVPQAPLYGVVSTGSPKVKL